MSNPLLDQQPLPDFQAIKAEHVLPAIQQILAENRADIHQLTESLSEHNWQNLIEPLDELDDRLDQAFSPVRHMNAVVNSDELREAYNHCLPLLSEYSTEMGQSKPLFQAYQNLHDSAEFDQLDTAKKTVIEHALRDFRLAGVALDDEKKARFGAIRKQLSELTSGFSDNVLDATQAWTKLITDPEQLAGVPDSALAAMAQAAEQKGEKGYLLTLEFPSYFPVISYCDNRALRKEVYRAYATRASELAADDKWDNTDRINQILALRHELALLLGFNNYAELSLATKMAESTQQVIDFLNDLAQRAKPRAEKEYAELTAFAHDQFGQEDLQPWDVTYYSEKLRQARYDLSQEALRPYFPAPKVINGLFAVAERLFDIQIEPLSGVSLWHKDAQAYSILRGKQEIARFYLDLYARSQKRGGAWMDECRVRRRLGNGNLQLPVAYLTCNFSGPVGDKPALLTHNEVTTLFHEFGHGLHHMLTRIEAAGVSGIRGVAWDAVELPSQFLENWCWQPQALALISGHYESSEPLPAEMLDKLLAAKNFQSAMQLVRQLEFSLFDFRIHLEYNPAQPRPVQDTLNEVRQQVAVVPISDFNRFQNSFTHIFAGGYAAGYYSYKWAEVLSADAFSRFEDEGIFNAETGRSFVDCILSRGGSEEPMALFKAFRGREPTIDALLRHSGFE